MNFEKANNLLATTNFILGLIGYTFIASVGSLFLEDESETQILTVPYRAVTLGVSMLLILLNCKKRFQCSNLLMILVFYWMILFIRMAFDFYYDDDLYITADSKRRTVLYVFGIVFPSTLACVLTYKNINFKIAYYFSLVLLFLSAICNFISNEALTAIDEASEGRLQGGAALNTISFGYSGVYLAILCFCNLSNKTIERILMLLGIGVGVFIMLRAGSRGPLFAFVLCIIAYYAFLQRGGITKAIIAGVFIMLFFVIFSESILSLIGMISPVMEERMNATIESGDISGRDEVYKQFFELWRANPIFGSQFTLYYADQVGYCHNIIFDAMLCAGVFGLFIMCYFYYKVFHFSYLCVKYRSPYLWMAFLFAVFFISHLSSGAFYNDPAMSIALVIIAMKKKDIDPVPIEPSSGT